VEPVPPHPGHQEAATSVHYTTSCKHSLVLLRLGEIIVRNMLRLLQLSIKFDIVASIWLFILLYLRFTAPIHQVILILIVTIHRMLFNELELSSHQASMISKNSMQ
jgi:hypothetical protein